MQVFVKMLTGRTMTINIDVTDTIEELKHKIFLKENIPTDIQRLISRGMSVEDQRTLSDYGISHEDTLNLVLRVRPPL